MNKATKFLILLEGHKEFKDYKEWLLCIKKLYPHAKITKDDSSGNTYGDHGDITAHIGPDMQSDVVGIFSPSENYGWCDDGKN